MHSRVFEGIADYVRLKAGNVPGHWVNEGGGDRWEQGYDVTARFFDSVVVPAPAEFLPSHAHRQLSARVSHALARSSKLRGTTEHPRQPCPCSRLEALRDSRPWPIADGTAGLTGDGGEGAREGWRLAAGASAGDGDGPMTVAGAETSLSPTIFHFAGPCKNGLQSWLFIG